MHPFRRSTCPKHPQNIHDGCTSNKGWCTIGCVSLSSTLLMLNFSNKIHVRTRDCRQSPLEGTPMSAARWSQRQQLDARHGTPSRRPQAAPPFPLTPAGEVIQPPPPTLPPEAWPKNPGGFFFGRSPFSWLNCCWPIPSLAGMLFGTC